MKDVFLVFLLVIAVLLGCGYGLFAWSILQDDDEDAGCVALWGGLVVVSVIGSILYVVGTNVGVHMPAEWK